MENIILIKNRQYYKTFEEGVIKGVSHSRDVITDLENKINEAKKYIVNEAPVMEDEEGSPVYLYSTIWGEELMKILGSDSNE